MISMTYTNTSFYVYCTFILLSSEQISTVNTCVLQSVNKSKLVDFVGHLFRLYDIRILNDIQYVIAYNFRIKISKIILQKFHFVSGLSHKSFRASTNQIFQLFFQLGFSIIPKFFGKYFRIAWVRFRWFWDVVGIFGRIETLLLVGLQLDQNMMIPQMKNSHEFIWIHHRLWFIAYNS